MSEPVTRVAVRLIIISNGKLLLTYDSRDKYYFYTGGRMEYGETIEDCAKREVREELGQDTEFSFNKILYVRDLLLPEHKVHNVELFILGTVNKFDELEKFIDPEHKGRHWATWVDIENMPENIFPRPMTKILLDDYKKGFTDSGRYVGMLQHDVS